MNVVRGDGFSLELSEELADREVLVIIVSKSGVVDVHSSLEEKRVVDILAAGLIGNSNPKRPALATNAMAEA